MQFYIIKQQNNLKTHFMKQVFVVMLVAFIFTACKKEKGITPEPIPPVATEKKLIKMQSNYSNGSAESENYSYDAQGRLSTTLNDSYREAFDYKSATQIIVTARKVSNNELISTKECTLDAAGRIVTIIMKSSAGAEIYRYDYTYNAEGYLVLEKGSKPGNPNEFRFEYNVVNGNIISAKGYFDNVLSENSDYKVDGAKLNKSQMSYSGYWYSNTLFGKPNKNLIVEYKNFNTAGTLKWHSQTNYELNSDGYPVKYTKSYPLTGFIENTTLTFE
jgi:hypothetical protein